MRNIAYIAGEASGDRHAAALHQSMRSARANEPITAWGIGGRMMRGNGIDLVADSSGWGAIGVVEALRGTLIYFAAMRMIKRELLRRKPDAIILVDFGFFNVRLARWAKQMGIGPVIYYLPPGSWKRNAGLKRSRELAALCDLIVTPFQWSHEHLSAAGAHSCWLGHPLIDIVRPTMDVAQFDAEYGIDPKRPIITLLPGSRTAEVEHILPMMLRAAAIITKRVPGTQFLLGAAPNLKRSHIERILREAQDSSAGSKFRIIERAGDKLKQMAATAMDAAAPGQALVTNEGFLLKPAKSGEDQESQPWQHVESAASQTATLAIVENLTYDCLSRADLVITASGTATLEAAILGKPMIIVYRGSRLMEVEYHLRKSKLGISFMGLPNIIAGEKVVPELLQHDASPEAVSDLAVGMLVQPERLMQAKKIMSDVIRPALGEAGVIDRAAEAIWSRIEAGRGVSDQRTV